MRAVPFVLAILLFAGCSGDKLMVGPPPPPPPLPESVTPQRAILRLIATFEQKRITEYAELFTADFTYEFSNSTDPDLVTKYSTGWFKSDETESSLHLFQGYTPAGQPFAPAAGSINIDFKTTQPVDDNGAGVDPVTHKYLVTGVDGQVVIATSPDPTTYVIENNTNVFYLVRGDLANLSPGQPADSLHWYIDRWVDLTTATKTRVGTNSPMPGRGTTWARLKAAYR